MVSEFTARGETGCALCIIEIKNRFSRALVRTRVEALRRQGNNEHSFNWPSLRGVTVMLLYSL